MEELKVKLQEANKKEKGKEVQNATLNRYFSNINSYLKTVYNAKDDEFEKYYKNLKWLEDHTKIINYFDNNFTKYNTKRTILGTFKILLRAKEPQTDKDIKLQKLLTEQLINTENDIGIAKNEATIIKTPIISFDNFNKFVDLISKNYKTQQDALMYKLLWHTPMRNEISSLQIIKSSSFKKLSDNEKNNKNYLIISNKDIKIYRDEYKTNNHYGSKLITIEDSKLATSIREYIKQEGIKEEEYLFVENDKRFMKDFKKGAGNKNVSTYLSNTSRKFLDKPLAETNILKSVIRHNFDLIGEEDIKKKREFLKTISKKRGTTMEVLIRDYLVPTWQRNYIKIIEKKKKK